MGYNNCAKQNQIFFLSVVCVFFALYGKNTDALFLHTHAYAWDVRFCLATVGAMCFSCVALAAHFFILGVVCLVFYCNKDYISKIHGNDSVISSHLSGAVFAILANLYLYFVFDEFKNIQDDFLISVGIAAVLWLIHFILRKKIHIILSWMFFIAYIIIGLRSTLWTSSKLSHRILYYSDMKDSLSSICGMFIFLLIIVAVGNIIFAVIMRKSEELKRKLSDCRLSISNDKIVVNTYTSSGENEIHTISFKDISEVWYQDPNFNNRQHCNFFIRRKNGMVFSLLIENAKLACDTISQKITSRNRTNVNVNFTEDNRSENCIYCLKCGTKLKSSSNFCSKCGYELDK